MRIGLDISAVTVGKAAGIETYTRAFLKVLGRVGGGSGDTFYVFTTRNNGSLLDGLPGFIRPVWMPGSNERRWARVLMQQTVMPYMVRRLHLDVINFQANYASLWLSCASVVHIKTLHHYQEAGSIPWNQRIVRRALYHPSASRADLIIANTENTKREICRHLKVPEVKVVVIPEGVDTDLFRPLSAEEREEHITRVLSRYSVSPPYVLFVSSLFPYKNASTLIHAFAQAVTKYQQALKPYRLVIVGGDASGHLEELRRLADSVGVGERTLFVGHIADRQVVRCFYAGADVFVYPSRYETFGLTVLEAMACGTPVVASNATSLPEVVGDAGVLVDPSDEDEMAQAIYSVLTDETLRGDLTQRGLARSHHFSWEETVRRTVEAYQQAVDLRCRHRGAKA